MNDDELTALARQLGDGAARHLDVARAEAAVLARLRQPRVHPWAGWLRAAAVLALVAGGLRLAFRAGGGEETSGSVAMVAPAALGALTTDELGTVLDSLMGEAPVEALAAAGLGQLDERELEALLGRMEG